MTRDTLTDERDEALYKAYKDLIRKHGNYARLIPKKMLYEELVESPAPKFYIGASLASKIISRKIKEDKGR